MLSVCVTYPLQCIQSIMSDLEKEISELADYFNELDLQVQKATQKKVTKSGDIRN